MPTCTQNLFISYIKKKKAKACLKNVENTPPCRFDIISLIYSKSYRFFGSITCRNKVTIILTILSFSTFTLIEKLNLNRSLDVERPPPLSY